MAQVVGARLTEPDAHRGRGGAAPGRRGRTHSRGLAAGRRGARAGTRYREGGPAVEGRHPRVGHRLGGRAREGLDRLGPHRGEEDRQEDRRHRRDHRDDVHRRQPGRHPHQRTDRRPRTGLEERRVEEGRRHPHRSRRRQRHREGAPGRPAPGRQERHPGEDVLLRHRRQQGGVRRGRVLRQPTGESVPRLGDGFVLRASNRHSPTVATDENVLPNTPAPAPSFGRGAGVSGGIRVRTGPPPAGPPCRPPPPPPARADPRSPAASPHRAVPPDR